MISDDDQEKFFHNKFANELHKMVFETKKPNLISKMDVVSSCLQLFFCMAVDDKEKARKALLDFILIGFDESFDFAQQNKGGRND